MSRRRNVRDQKRGTRYDTEEKSRQIRLPKENEEGHRQTSNSNMIVVTGRGCGWSDRRVEIPVSYRTGLQIMERRRALIRIRIHRYPTVFFLPNLW
ncbi:hypothetical protein BDA96_10G293800 [Sorghum bicolor]|uniref:Uncharacterized protein n=1 Tax=Sorghum bicolor TaxID=4558 RepID=A0A921Q7K3_SORBI|nr:hypothetical protein BDA96_10G293800 [Sorghum bicolor]